MKYAIITKEGDVHMHETFIDFAHVYTSIATDWAILLKFPQEVRSRIMTATEEHNKEFCHDILNIKSVKKIAYI